MSEIVDSLRKAEVSAHVGHGGDWKSIYATAADLIEEQAARIAELEGNLKKAQLRAEIMTGTAERFETRADKAMACVSDLQARLSEAVKVLEKIAA